MSRQRWRCMMLRGLRLEIVKMFTFKLRCAVRHSTLEEPGACSLAYRDSNDVFLVAKHGQRLDLQEALTTCCAESSRPRGAASMGSGRKALGWMTQRTMH
jgi:hypothetical protein